jgi:hypothetical protein
MPRQTRVTIGENLLSAKRQAVDRTWNARAAGLHRGVNGISTRPEANVVGVGIGRKFVKRKPTDRPSVRFYVVRKLDRDLIPRAHSLPSHIDGVETDVIETGRFRAQAMAARNRRRPAQPGCSIGFRLPPPQEDLIMAGTLGALVGRGTARFILSNNHVLANENSLPPDSEVYQPGLLDHGDPATDAIARLSQFIALNKDGPNRVDCAIAEVANSDAVRARLLAKIGKLASDQPFDAVEGARVEKVGRGTGYTTGTVYDVSANIKLLYELGELDFVDQILIRGAGGVFSEYGDSGALVVEADARHAIGLLIGGSTDFSVANHLSDVLTELNVGLVL